MPRAVRGVAGLALRNQGSFATIQCDGREFREPAWLVNQGPHTCGPLGFRQGDWNDQQHEFEFRLMCTQMNLAMESMNWTGTFPLNKVAQAYGLTIDESLQDVEEQIIAAVATSYRDNVRFIEV
jgi:hypothetical protein